MLGKCARKTIVFPNDRFTILLPPRTVDTILWARTVGNGLRYARAQSYAILKMRARDKCARAVSANKSAARHRRGHHHPGAPHQEMRTQEVISLLPNRFALGI